MKKQLLIAAVAATMTSVAMADISISGAAKINYTFVDSEGTTPDTNTFKNEMDLSVKGTTGATTIVMNFANDESAAVGNGLVSEDNYVMTSIEDVNLKVGDWDNGNNALRASSRANNKFEASTTFGVVGVKYEAQGDTIPGDGNDAITLSVDVSGVKASYKDKEAGNKEIKLSTTVEGINASYHKIDNKASNSDRSVFEVSTTFEGVSINVAKASADNNISITGDSWMGDFEGATGSYLLSNDQDVTAIKLSTAMAGNTVAFTHSSIDDGAANTDTSINKVALTRPLANGTTFEATYTDVSDDAVNMGSSTLDLELAVKF